MISRLAILCATVLLAASSLARADDCDVSGRYDVKIQWGAHKCLAPDAWTVRLLVLKEGDGYAVRNTRGARFAVTSRAQDGVCKMKLAQTVDHYTMGAGPGDYVRFDLELTVAGAGVSGGGGYDELGPDAKATQAKCTDHVTVAGTRLPIVPADLRFDEAAARTALVELVQALAEKCDLPYFDVHRTGSVKVELKIAADGGGSGLKLDGADQNLAKTCDGFDRSFLNDFPNPSGKPQLLRFPIEIGKIHPRPKAKELIVIPADKKPIATDIKDCVKDLSELESGDDESLRGPAKELCDLRVKHQAARERLLASMARIVKEYREESNHDHAHNLPTTIRSLQDVVKACLAAVESQEWCHNIGCALEPEQNATFCDNKAADVADAIVGP